MASGGLEGCLNSLDDILKLLDEVTFGREDMRRVPDGLTLEQIYQTKQKTRRILSYMHTFENAVAAINRLPPEMLANIFELVIQERPPMQKRAPGQPPDDCFLITQVCRYWRRTAVTTPRLWTHVRSSTSYPRPQRIRLLLERSGILPLDVDMDILGDTTELQYILSHIARIEQLHIVTSPSWFDLRDLNMPAPSLRTLSLELREMGMASVPTFPPFNGQTPLLENVLVDKLNAYICQGFRNLTRFCLCGGWIRDGEILPEQFLGFLAANTTLEDLILQGIGLVFQGVDPVVIGFPAPSLPATRRQPLLHLRRLRFADCHPTTVMYVLGCLEVSSHLAIRIDALQNDTQLSRFFPQDLSSLANLHHIRALSVTWEPAFISIVGVGDPTRPDAGALQVTLRPKKNKDNLRRSTVMDALQEILPFGSLEEFWVAGSHNREWISWDHAFGAMSNLRKLVLHAITPSWLQGPAQALSTTNRQGSNVPCPLLAELELHHAQSTHPVLLTEWLFAKRVRYSKSICSVRAVVVKNKRQCDETWAQAVEHWEENLGSLKNFAVQESKVEAMDEPPTFPLPEICTTPSRIHNFWPSWA